jgi:putative oxidoreductase
MNSIIHFFNRPARGPASVVLIRIAVGLIFFTQGILKYIDSNLGVVRFGFLMLLGVWTRATAIPLFIVIVTAITTTKIPELFRANQGFWYMVSDARTDFAMLCSLIFLICEGGGAWSLDARHGPESN